MNIDRMESAIHHIKTLEGQLADYKRELVEAMNDGGMAFSPMPVGVVANGGGVIPARNPVTGRTRKEKTAGASRAPRAPRGIDPSVIETVRTCLGDTAKTIPQIVYDTGLHRGIVTRVLAHISAIGSGGPKSMRYRLADGSPPQVPPPVEVEDEDPTDEEG